MHFHDGTEAWVPYVVERAEEIYRGFQKRFGWRPAKVNLVLLDIYDYSNAIATVFPENTVYVFLQPPPGNPYFGTMDTWIDLVLVHELVHVFHLDKPHDVWGLPIPELSRLVYGKNPFMCAIPNVLDPDWQSEGIATLLESEGGVGRLNNRFFRDELLAYAYFGGRLTPDQMSVAMDDWPYGRAYLFGSLYLEYLMRKRGEREVMERIVNSSYWMDCLTYCSAGCIPGPLLFKDINDYYAWLREVSGAVRRIGRVDPEFITLSGGDKGHISLSPSGRFLAFTESNRSDYPSVKVLDLESGRVFREVKAYASGPVSWSGDTLLLFSQYEYHRNFYVLSDVYSLNVITGEVRRLTVGERAHSPILTPHGLMYVRREGPYQSVILGDSVILRGGMGEGFTDLKFYRDTLFFTFYDGWNNVAFLPLGSDSVRFITRTREVSLLSHVDSSGVYLTNDFTAYVYSEGRFERISQHPFSLLYPIPYKGELLVLTMGKEGLDVAKIRRVSKEESFYTDFKRERKYIPTETLRVRPYNPIPHLLPKYWHPISYVYYQPLGDDSLVPRVSVGVSTSGWDVLNRHTYSVVSLVDMPLMDVYPPDTVYSYTSLIYVYDGLWPSLGLAAEMTTNTSPRGSVGLSYALLSPFITFPFRSVRRYSDVEAYLNVLYRGGKPSVGGGVGINFSMLYGYKYTSPLYAEGFGFSGDLFYTDGIGGRVRADFALKKGWVLINASLGYTRLPYETAFVSDYLGWDFYSTSDRMAYVGLSVYPNVFHRSFPDLNVSVFPPFPWAFVSFLALSRVYPSLDVFYTNTWRGEAYTLGLAVNFDLLLLSNTVIGLKVGYSLYPRRYVYALLR